MKPADTTSYILLIEDDQWLAKSYQTIISQIIPVKAVESGDQAMRLIDESLPRLIIADVMLESGMVIDLLHELQSHADTAPIPIILCTSLASDLKLKDLKLYGVVKIFDKATLTLDELRTAAAEHV